MSKLVLSGFRLQSWFHEYFVLGCASTSVFLWSYSLVWFLIFCIFVFLPHPVVVWVRVWHDGCCQLSWWGKGGWLVAFLLQLATGRILGWDTTAQSQTNLTKQYELAVFFCGLHKMCSPLSFYPERNMKETQANCMYNSFLDFVSMSKSSTTAQQSPYWTKRSRNRSDSQKKTWYLIQNFPKCVCSSNSKK